MPYDPHAPDQASHAQLFRVMHVAAVLAPVALVLYIVSGAYSFPFRFAAMFAGLPLIYPAIPTRYIDPYARSLMRIGASWAAAVVGVWLTIRGVIGFGDLGHALGKVAATSDMAAGFSGREEMLPLPAWFDDIVLLTALAACAFHAGFQWAYRRGDGAGERF